MFTKFKNSYFSYFLMYFFYFLSWALFSALISVYLMGKGLDAKEVSLIVSASFLTSMIAQPFIGMLSDHIGAKKVNMILFSLTLLGGAFFAVSKTMIMMMIGYSFVLTLLNGTNPIIEKIATASPYSYGKIRIWGTIGYAVGTQAAGFIYDVIAPEAVYICFIATMLVTIVGAYGAEPQQISNDKEQQKSTVWDLLKNKKYLYFLLISAIFYACLNAGNIYVPSMYVEDGMNAKVASTILSLAVFAETPFVLFSYLFMDKVANKTLLLIAYSMACIQFAVYGFDLALPIKVLATIVMKHPASMLYITINLKVIHTIVKEEQIITALAFVATIKNLVSVISQNIAGALVDAVGYTRFFLIFFLVLVLGWILTMLFKVEDGNGQGLFS